MQVLLVLLTALAFALSFSASKPLLKLFGPAGARRAMHVLAGSACLLFPIYLDYAYVALLGVVMFLVLSLGESFKWWPSLHSVDRPGVSLFPLGVAVAALFGYPIFFFALSVLTLADPAASLVGEWKGKASKSWWGFGAFTAVALLLCAAFMLALEAPFSILFLAPVVALIERFSPPGADNILIPLAAGLGLLALLGWG